MLTGTLPGENDYVESTSTWLFFYDKEETEKLIQEMFYDRDLEQENDLSDNTTNESSNTNSSSTSSNTSNSSTSKASKSDIKLEVINGTGEGKLLQQAVDELETAGYNVTRTGETNTTVKTIIIDKKNTSDTLLDNIELVLGSGKIQKSQSTSSKVDVTIIIGRDYQEN